MRSNYIAALDVSAAVSAATIVVPLVFGVAPAHADPDLTCAPGFVWRVARPTDNVCVTPYDRDRTAAENATADQRRAPNGGAYGPDTCLNGFVWRQAFDGDAVCVSPGTRQENIEWNAYRCGTVTGVRQHAGYCGPPPPRPTDPGVVVV